MLVVAQRSRTISASASHQEPRHPGGAAPAIPGKRPCGPPPPSDRSPPTPLAATGGTRRTVRRMPPTAAGSFAPGRPSPPPPAPAAPECSSLRRWSFFWYWQSRHAVARFLGSASQSPPRDPGIDVIDGGVDRPVGRVMERARPRLRELLRKDSGDRLRTPRSNGAAFREIAAGKRVPPEHLRLHALLWVAARRGGLSWREADRLDCTLRRRSVLRGERLDHGFELVNERLMALLLAGHPRSPARRSRRVRAECSSRVKAAALAGVSRCRQPESGQTNNAMASPSTTRRAPALRPAP